MTAIFRSDFRTFDPDEARAQISRAYGQTSLRVGGSVESFVFEQSRYDLGPVRLDAFSHTLTTEYTFEPLGTLQMVRILRGRVSFRGDTPSPMGPGDVFLTSRPERGHTIELVEPNLQVTGVDLSLLAEVTDDGVGLRTRQFRPGPLPPLAVQQWQHATSYVTGLVTKTPEAATSPLILGAARRLLGATLLAVLAPGVLSDQNERATDRLDATPGSVRRAVAFLEANQDLDIGVADVARAARVSARALQLGFRRHLDTTPMGYLRQIRLNSVRAELIDSNCTDSITQIASRWGFTNPGQLSQQYRQTFGERPSDTKKQASSG